MEIRRISSARLKERLDKERSFALLDVRERGEYNAGHIPGATSLPRRDIEFRLARLLPVATVPVVAVGAGDAREERAAAVLMCAGYANVALLQGGFGAWRESGYPTATGVNVPSKAFGEIIHGDCEVREMTPEELASRLRRGETPVIIDVRTPEEYGRFCIPGGVNIPGGDLILWAEELKAASKKPIIVNCAGRTRGIIGAQTLTLLGVADACALKNGTMGWVLAGLDLERPHRTATEASNSSRAAAERYAAELAAAEKIPFVSVSEMEALLSQTRETLYPIDVRSPEEYSSGHIPGYFSLPGGQAVQCADDYIALRSGRIVFASERASRAVMAAYWFRKMGFSASVLDGGTEAWAAQGLEIEKGFPRESVLGLNEARATVRLISGGELENMRAHNDEFLVVDVGLSLEYQRGHVPGAVWIARDWLEERLPELYPDRRQSVVCACPDGRQSLLAAASLAEIGYVDVRVLDGGTNEWTTSGRPVETGFTRPLVESNDVVLSASLSGDKEAMRRYLAWEVELVRKDLVR
ncbi:MAG TPA: rhodanese-like domain-containing protein [Verrucomicrobiae bacterium]|nr:rhodanese-like domain-containing protein [Verrucomicrobiae bacterium]